MRQGQNQGTVAAAGLDAVSQQGADGGRQRGGGWRPTLQPRLCRLRRIPLLCGLHP